MDVSPTIKALFSLVDAYTPTHTRHATPLKPFVPAFIPAVGDIDAFVKPPRPDGADDGLGARVLDEPGAKQTDPAAFALRLRHPRDSEARSLERPCATAAFRKAFLATTASPAWRFPNATRRV